MKSLILALTVAITLAACAAGGGTSPTVPKKDIEQKADTKIADAGTEASEEGGDVGH